MKRSIFWFRRDLRLTDNTALQHALKSGHPVMPIFIFDQQILQELPADDARVNFIYNTLFKLNKELNKKGSSLLCIKGDPIRVWAELLDRFEISQAYRMIIYLSNDV